MNQARIVIKAIDGITYTSIWNEDLYEKRDAIIGALQQFSKVNYLSLTMDDDETLYFNPANIIYAKVETR